MRLNLPPIMIKASITSWVHYLVATYRSPKEEEASLPISEGGIAISANCKSYSDEQFNLSYMKAYDGLRNFLYNEHSHENSEAVTSLFQNKREKWKTKQLQLPKDCSQEEKRRLEERTTPTADL